MDNQAHDTNMPRFIKKEPQLEEGMPHGWRDHSPSVIIDLCTPETSLDLEGPHEPEQIDSMIGEAPAPLNRQTTHAMPSTAPASRAPNEEDFEIEEAASSKQSKHQSTVSTSYESDSDISASRSDLVAGEVNGGPASAQHDHHHAPFPITSPTRLPTHPNTVEHKLSDRWIEGIADSKTVYLKVIISGSEYDYKRIIPSKDSWRALIGSSSPTFIGRIVKEHDYIDYHLECKVYADRRECYITGSVCRELFDDLGVKPGDCLKMERAAAAAAGDESGESPSSLSRKQKVIVFSVSSRADNSDEHLVTEKCPDNSINSSVDDTDEEEDSDDGSDEGDLEEEEAGVGTAVAHHREERHSRRQQWLRGIQGNKTTYLKVTLTNYDCSKNAVRPPEKWYEALLSNNTASKLTARVAKDDAPSGFIEYEVNAHPPRPLKNYYRMGGYGLSKLLNQLKVEAGDCLKMEKVDSFIAGKRKPVVLLSVIKRAVNPDAKEVLKKSKAWYSGNGKIRTALKPAYSTDDDDVDDDEDFDEDEAGAEKQLKHQLAAISASYESTSGEESEEEAEEEAGTTNGTAYDGEARHETNYQWKRGSMHRNSKTIYLKITLTESDCSQNALRAPQEWYPALLSTTTTKFTARIAKKNGGCLEYEVKAYPPKPGKSYYRIGRSIANVFQQLKVEAGDCLKMEKVVGDSTTARGEKKEKKPVVLFSLIKRKDNPDAEQVLRTHEQYKARAAKGRGKRMRTLYGGVLNHDNNYKDRKPQSEKKKKKEKKKRQRWDAEKMAAPPPPAKKRLGQRPQETEMEMKDVSAFPPRGPALVTPEQHQQQQQQPPAPRQAPPPPSNNATAVLLTRKLLRNDDNKVVGVKCSFYFEPGSRSLAEISQGLGTFGVEHIETGVHIDDLEVCPAENTVRATLKLRDDGTGGGDENGVATAALNRAIEAFREAL